MISVRQIGEMDQKLNTLVQQLNVPFPFQNPITMGLSMLGFISGVDNTGGAGIVILPAPSFQDMNNRAALLIPTKNLDDLLSIMEPEDVEPGIRKVMLQGQEVFVAQKANHALFSPSLDVVKAILASKTSLRSKLNAHQAKHYGKDDVVIWGNAEAITSSDTFKAVMPLLQMMNVDSEMLMQMRTVALSLRITPAGISIGLYTEAVPETDMHRAMCSHKGGSECLLLGLPQGGHVVSYGVVSTKEASEMGAEMLAKFLDNPQVQALGLEPTKLARIKEMILSRLKLLRTLAVSVSGLPAGPDGLVSLAKVVGMDGDPQEGLTMFAELISLIKGGLVPQEEAAAALAALEYKPGAETIDGISVDHLTFDLSKVAGDDPEKAEWVEEATAVISKVLGKDGILFRMGVVDANHVAMTFGGGAERFKTVAALVKEKKTPLSEDGGIQRARKHLPATLDAEGYLAVDQLLNLIGAIAKAADQPMPPVSLGELNAPIGFATQPVEKGGSQVELFIPMELIIAVKDLGMGMMGGPGAPAHAPAGPSGEPEAPSSQPE